MACRQVKKAICRDREGTCSVIEGCTGNSALRTQLVAQEEVMEQIIDRSVPQSEARISERFVEQNVDVVVRQGMGETLADLRKQIIDVLVDVPGTQFMMDPSRLSKCPRSQAKTESNWQRAVEPCRRVGVGRITSLRATCRRLDAIRRLSPTITGRRGKSRIAGTDSAIQRIWERGKDVFVRVEVESLFPQQCVQQRTVKHAPVPQILKDTVQVVQCSNEPLSMCQCLKFWKKRSIWYGHRLHECNDGSVSKMVEWTFTQIV